jgi:hypothetical protein
MICQLDYFDGKAEELDLDCFAWKFGKSPHTLGPRRERAILVVYSGWYANPASTALGGADATGWHSTDE